MPTERQSREGCIDHCHYRHKDGHVVDLYMRPDGTHDLWVNDGPPKTHYLGVTEAELEAAILSGQLKGNV